MSPDIQVVIMAGGSGTRFWPLSRRRRPKQFLPILSSRTMLEETVERLKPLVSLRNIHTVANAEQTRTIHALLPNLPQRNLIVEPMGKNTAPSLILATAAVFQKNPTAAVVVLPSDHLITETDLFLRQLEAGAQAASSGDYLVTFGIPPSFPSTGYGYIHIASASRAEFNGFPFHDVLGFKEKPSLEKAREFLAAGGYYWNSGMFIWTAEVFSRKLEKFAGEYFAFWPRMLKALGKGGRAELSRIFREIPALSIDYALMEKADGVLVAPSRFGWSDVGAWSSLYDVWTKDSGGNVARGETVLLESEGCLVYNPGKITALIGLKDVIVVDTKDALLVGRRDRDQKVKDIIEMLKAGNKKKHL